MRTKNRFGVGGAKNKAKLFIGIMYKDREVYDRCIQILRKKFGNIEEKTLEYNFDFTDYYDAEMGKGIKKRFIVFSGLIDMPKLADIKVFTNNAEDRFRADGKRRVNIDPGYVTKTQLVLASMKERANKIYLRKGVYADLNLIFRKEGCIELKNTFPDFRDEKIKKFFAELRRLL